MLLKHQAAWEKLDWTETRIPISDQGYFGELRKGIYTFGDGLCISCVQLPSILCGTGVRTWTYCLEFPQIKFTTDPDQDLLVVLERPE